MANFNKFSTANSAGNSGEYVEVYTNIAICPDWNINPLPLFIPLATVCNQETLRLLVHVTEV